MHALRWHGRDDLRLDDVPDPEPGPGEVVIEVAYAGICGTDLHEFAHGPNMIRTRAHPLSGQAPPMTLGHELSGRVLAVGAEVHTTAPGERVTVDPCLHCGTCRWCTRGEHHICARGGSVGLAGAGGFARYLCVPAVNVLPVPDAVDDRSAALAEPLAVGLHAVRRAGVSAGDHVLVLGAGPIGIAAVLAARVSGAARIDVSEPAPARAARAMALGATEVFDPTTDDVRRIVFARTGRIGPDVVVEATGRPELVDLAVTSVRRGGHVALAGISDSRIDVDLRAIVLYERTVSGSLGHHFDIPRVLDLMATGRLDASALVTGVHPLSEGREAFAELTADRGRHLKVLLTPQET